MEMTGVRRLAGVLKVLVTITFICNLACLFLVPGLSMLRGPGELLEGIAYFQDEGGLTVFFRLTGFFLAGWSEAWGLGPYVAVLAAFLLFCGGCTAVILWQGRKVLDTIIREDTFTLANAANMRRAAVCCFLISAAALLRALWGLFYYGSLAPLVTYNALFCPVFLMAGLLCLIMSALFRQAAELKAENDLTI